MSHFVSFFSQMEQALIPLYLIVNTLPMNTYTNFNELKGNRIWLLKRGFFDTVYELTDNVNCYARSRTEGLLSSTTVFESQSGTTVISSSMMGDLFLSKPDGTVIGQANSKILSNKIILKLTNGFEAHLASTSLWSSEHYWTDTTARQLMTFEGRDLSSLPIRLAESPQNIPNFEILLFTGIKYLMHLNANDSILLA